MSYPPISTLLDRNELLDQLYLKQGIQFQKMVQRLNVEPPSQPWSKPDLDFENQNLEKPTPRLGSAEELHQIPKLFALIIGINKYQATQFKRLRGAVPDGMDFKDYLMDRLSVPESQIITLFDQEATRSAIIEGFRKLRDNKDIDKGDPIFIFYAGHGSQIPPHPDWEPQGRNAKMEVILPYDCGAVDGQQAEPIPDRTIATLIDEIAAEKGNNITVVFDCCHSASGSRGPGDNDKSLTLVRTAEMGDVSFASETDSDIWDYHSPANVPYDLEECLNPALGSSSSPSSEATEDLRSRSSSPYKGYLHRGLGSHMFISACRSFEEAVEYDGHGRLSSAILKLLHNTPPNKLSYRDLLAKIEPIPSQVPQCEGKDQDRLLFNGKVFLPRETYYIRFDHNLSKFTLNAGEVRGIAVGAEFKASSHSDELFKHTLGTFVVEKLLPYKSVLKFTSSTAQVLGQLDQQLEFSAIQTKPGNLEPVHLHIPLEDPFRVQYHSIRESSTANLEGVFLVDKPEEAHLKGCTMSDGHVVFVHSDKSPVKCLVTRHAPNLPISRHATNLATDSVKPRILSAVGDILESAARYFRELNRAATCQYFEDRIEVEFYKLEYSQKLFHPGLEHRDLVPVEPNLCRRRDDLKVIDFVVEGSNSENIPYGFKILNLTAENLYVNVFYFDNVNFSISSYYLTRCPKGDITLESPLKGEEALTVGYGSGGSPPLSYKVGEGRDLEVGFFKIYFSTQPVDLSDIRQGSAFEETRSPVPYSPPPLELWGTILIPIIQRLSQHSS